jgi:hypothetical protein
MVTNALSTSRAIGALLLVSGCTLIAVGAPPSRSQPAPRTAASSAPSAPSAPASRAREIDTAQIAAWARQSAEQHVDCPVTPEQATELASWGRRGRSGTLVSAIGCMCGVELTCDGYQRASCPPIEPSSKLIVHNLGMADQPDADRDAIAAWEDRLYASRKAPLAKITRSPALPPPDRAAYLATVDARPILAALAEDKAHMAQWEKDKLWGGLADALSHEKAIVAQLEKRSCGAPSPEGRAYIAEAQAMVTAHKKDLAAEDREADRERNDPQLRSFDAQLKSLQAQLDEQEHIHGSARSLCPEHDSWTICKIQARWDDVNYRRGKRIDALAAGN